MMTSTYDSLPSRFDWSSYYSQQAAGMPQFPVFRARQRGGFLVPLLKTHGVPLLRWLGKQAASLAATAGSQYLNKGSLSKADMKGLLKNQGKTAAHSVLDRLKQQVGSGMMNHRRDMRLHSLLTPTAQQDGLLTNVHRVRGPSLSSPFLSNPKLRGRRKKTKTTGKKRRRKAAKAGADSPKNKKKKKNSKTAKKRKTSNKKTGVKKRKTTRKNKSFNHTIFS